MFRIILIVLLILSFLFYLGSKAQKQKKLNDSAIQQKKQYRQDLYNTIEKLSDLKDRGIITEEEFRIEKKKLLNQ